MGVSAFTRLAAAIVVALPGTALAQAPQAAQSVDELRQQITQLRQELDSLRADYEARLDALEARLATNEAAPAAAPAAPAGGQVTAEVPSGAAGAGGPAGALPLYGGAAATSKIFNPDIAVIGDFLGTGGVNDIAPGPSFQMHESEASFQAIVDPYSRADFFLSFGEEGVDLEEGYVTFPAIPGGLLVRVGKMRQAFGKVNTLHNHVLPWADRPLVTENLLAGEDGLNDAGVSAARLIPNPWLFLEATGQVFRGDSGDVFQASERGDLSYLGHLRAYQDLGESTNLDLGVSYAYGHNASGVEQGPDPGRYTTSLTGVDATLRWRPLRRSIYHSFVGRGEVVWSRREQPGGRQNAAGYFVSGDYQMARRWFVGARFDWSERAVDASLTDTGGSFILTYWPSEFAQVRGQYRRTGYGEGRTADELLFQAQFAIGAHGAHPF
jgi:hypothetical protein